MDPPLQDSVRVPLVNPHSMKPRTHVKITFNLALSTGLSIFWSNACSRGFTLHDVVRVLCEEPSKLSRLSHRKGKIALGMEADLVLWDPDECFVVRKNLFFYRARLKTGGYHGEVVMEDQISESSCGEIHSGC